MRRASAISGHMAYVFRSDSQRRRLGSSELAMRCVIRIVCNKQVCEEQGSPAQPSPAMEDLRAAASSFAQAIQKQAQSSLHAHPTLKPPLPSLHLPHLLPQQQGMPNLPSFPFSKHSARDRAPPTPLLDIEDVRAFIRSKFGPPSGHSQYSHHEHHGRHHDHHQGQNEPHGHSEHSGYGEHHAPHARNEHNVYSEHHGSHSHSEQHGHHHGLHGHSEPHGHLHHDGHHERHDDLHGHRENPQHGHTHGHVRHVSSGVFGIGTMGSSSSSSEGGGHSSDGGGYIPLSSSHIHEPQQRQQQSNTPSSSSHHSDCLLDIEDVRDLIESFLHHSFIRRRPTTSWKNKMPWHVPRAPFLAKGLNWPPERFESEMERKEFYRKARKRKPFLLGSPPLWTVTAFNLLFLQLLMFNPVRKFSNFLRSLP